MISKSYVNDLCYKIVGCAINVHKCLGPGLLESVYESCFVEELIYHELNVARQVSVPYIIEGKCLNKI